MSEHEAPTTDLEVVCRLCGERVAADHTIVHAEHGRLCSFCCGELEDRVPDEIEDTDLDLADWD